MVVAGACATRPGGTGGVSGTVPPFPVSVGPLGDLGEFVVEADQPTERTILIDLDGVTIPAGTEINGGTFLFDPDTIAFTPAGTGKFQVAAQTTPFDFQVTGWAFGKEPTDGDCGNGDEYGPYTIMTSGHHPRHGGHGA